MKDNGEHTISRVIDLYFSGSYPAELEEEVRQWLADEKDSEKKDIAIRAIFDEMVIPETNPDNYTRESLKKLQGKLGIISHTVGKKGASIQRLTLKVAAVLLPIFILGAALVIRQWDSGADTEGEKREFYTRLYSVKTEDNSRMVVLNDGTVVILDAHSHIKYSDNREVTLSGKAYFDVAKNPDEPFVVHTEGMEVTVHGTTFDVDTRTGEGIQKVMLYSGSVSVSFEGSDAQEEIVLEPGKSLTFDTDSGGVDIDEVSDSDSVMAGTVDLEYMSFENILHSLGAYFDMQVDNCNEIINDEIYTLKFDHGDQLETILQSLQRVSGKFDYEINGNKITIE